MNHEARIIILLNSHLLEGCLKGGVCFKLIKKAANLTTF